MDDILHLPYIALCVLLLLSSYQEFLDQTKRKEFEEDGWDPIDPNAHPVYNEDEYKQYAQQHEEEIRKMIEAGVVS